MDEPIQVTFAFELSIFSSLRNISALVCPHSVLFTIKAWGKEHASFLTQGHMTRWKFDSRGMFPPRKSEYYIGKLLFSTVQDMFTVTIFLLSINNLTWLHDWQWVLYIAVEKNWPTLLCKIVLIQLHWRFFEHERPHTSALCLTWHELSCRGMHLNWVQLWTLTRPL